MTMWKRIAAAAAAMLLMMACAVLTASASELEGYDENDCLVFVKDPGDTSPFVYYYKGGEQQSTDVMTWVDDPQRGKVLKLDGASEYLAIDYYQTPQDAISFATWINFAGAADASNPASAYWQRLLTISSPSERYFTVSPHAMDETITNEQGSLNGVFMEYYPGHMEGGEQGPIFRGFDGVTAGMSHFGLPQNEWHHMAIVSDTTAITIYVDGAVAVHGEFRMFPGQMNVHDVMIGKGIWGNATLNAMLDDTMMFDKALSQDQVRVLMQTGDPAAASVDAPIVSTTTGYQPTAPVTTVPTQDMQARNDDQPLTIFGLEAPLWGVAITVGLLGLFIVLSVTVSLYERYWRKKHNKPLTSKKKKAAPKKAKPAKVKKSKASKEDKDDEEPTLSIKEAALQKRREEHERFLAEEEQETSDETSES